MKNWLSRFFGSRQSLPPVTLSPEQQSLLEEWQALPKPDLTRSHFRSRYVVADVETSGLNMETDTLISIGAVAVVNGQIDFRDSFQVVLRQDVVSTTANILLHGIGGSEQREGIEPADALLSFLQYLRHDPLVAYHALFDKTMIERAMREFLGLRLDQNWVDLAWVMPDLFRDRMDAQVGLDDWLNMFGDRKSTRLNSSHH